MKKLIKVNNKASKINNNNSNSLIIKVTFTF